jgi:hypothetical protein
LKKQFCFFFKLGIEEAANYRSINVYSLLLHILTPLHERKDREFWDMQEGWGEIFNDFEETDQ